ncbi:hypothetical protein F3Y22_tig00017808pilonHSYRG00163 [Hibiscus syriacus]|uniref:Integrase catalytic domain-containing protein n=1 Tax=Hibiscus syriacus TaxID=106335 RepID=A0A6A3BW16_HIBSY|nr:hypothetical protein F3Y22_tig00017808pilonHSYRG00163 [Hibiscus syriacus]
MTDASSSSILARNAVTNGLDIAIEGEKPDDVEEKEWKRINRMACGTTMNDHITRFNQLVTDMMNMDVTFEDEDLALMLMGSLPDEFEYLETTLLHGKVDVSLSEVTAALYSYELRKKDKQENTSVEAEALVVRGRSKSQNKGSRERSKSKSRLSKDEYSDFAFAATPSTSCSSSWLLDSACSHHMTPNREWFFDFKELKGGIVYTTNNSPLDTLGIGSIRLRNQDRSIRTLTGVHYVPDLMRNLISVGTSKGLEVRAKDGIMRIISGALVIMKGIRKRNNVYYSLGSTIVGTAAVATSIDEHELEATKLWHMRLGHVGEKSLKLLIDQGLLKGARTCKLAFCEHCIKGKKTRVKFRTIIQDTKGILDYVHSDVWGPSKTTSLGGTHYYVTFVDDFSRRVWVYPMKTNDEVLGFFLKGKKMMETQTGRKIKRLRTDNSGEYKNDPFLKVCEEEGIGRHFTVRGTPQQNGVAERMNWTLVEKVRCMLSNAGLGKEFWAEALVYACHLVNCLPSIAIGEESEEEEVQTQEPPQQHESIALRKGKRTIRKLARYADMVSFASPIAIDDVPATFNEAVQSSEHKKWRIAMNEEIQSLQKNQTWKLASLPKGKKAIGCKCVYAKKYGFPDKNNIRYKARLVAKGYAQTEGVDYNEVFSPVVKHSSIRILLALVAQLDLELVQMDVKTAFLHGDLDEEIYMTQPDGFKVAEKEEMVCKLEKSLYGLKQSPRQWYKRFDKFMIGQKYTRSNMIIESDRNCETKDSIEQEFEMKDLGKAKKILGMDIRVKKLGRLCLSQKEYLRKVLKRFGINEMSKPISTPLAPHFKLGASMSPKDDAEREYMSKVPYASVVGSLMYAMVCTRPDISQAVGVDKQDGQCVVGYCDSDYAEAEYMAVTEAVKEAIWLQGLLGELGMEQKHIKVHCDSQSAIHLAKNQVYHARTKHIDVRYHFVREILEEGRVIIQKIRTTENPADMLTKVGAATIRRQNYSSLHEFRPNEQSPMKNSPDERLHFKRSKPRPRQLLPILVPVPIQLPVLTDFCLISKLVPVPIQLPVLTGCKLGFQGREICARALHCDWVSRVTFFYRVTPALATSIEAALKGRDPFHRSIPYPKGCPEIEGLFRYCGAAPYRASLPWLV